MALRKRVASIVNDYEKHRVTRPARVALYERGRLGHVTVCDPVLLREHVGNTGWAPSVKRRCSQEKNRTATSLGPTAWAARKTSPGNVRAGSPPPIETRDRDLGGDTTSAVVPAHQDQAARQKAGRRYCSVILIVSPVEERANLARPQRVPEKLNMTLLHPGCRYTQAVTPATRTAEKKVPSFSPKRAERQAIANLFLAVKTNTLNYLTKKEETGQLTPRRLNCRDVEGNSMLYYAAQSNYKEAAEMLLRHGADVNARSQDGNTPLHEAFRGKHHAVFRAGEADM